MKKIILSGTLILCASASFAGGTPWLTTPSSTSIQLSEVHQETKKFFIGEKDGELPADLIQDTVWIEVSRGILDNLSVDFRVGYAKTKFKPEDVELNESGRTDSLIGLNWRIRDEFIDSGPSLSMRIAATIAGDYEKDKVYSIGDGASGLEASFIMGKAFNQTLASSAEAGYRYRNNNVNNEYFINFSTYARFSRNLSSSLSYNIVHSFGDLDIGTPDFDNTGEKFSLVAENSQAANLGIAYQFSNINVGAQVGKVLFGRNTSKALSIGVSISVGL